MAYLIRNGLLQFTRRGVGPIPIALRNNVVKKNVLIIQFTRVVSSSSKKGATSQGTVTLSGTEKTPYEIELEKLENNSVRKGESYGFYDNDPVLDKIWFHTFTFLGFSVFLIFGMVMFCYNPLSVTGDKQWIYREARWQMAARKAKGEPLISMDYAPVEMIEQMVPPAGEWEKEWLENQPTTRPICTDWYGQNNQF